MATQWIWYLNIMHFLWAKLYKMVSVYTRHLRRRCCIYGSLHFVVYSPLTLCFVEYCMRPTLPIPDGAQCLQFHQNTFSSSRCLSLFLAFIPKSDRSLHMVPGDDDDDRCLPSSFQLCLYKLHTVETYLFMFSSPVIVCSLTIFFTASRRPWWDNVFLLVRFHCFSLTHTHTYGFPLTKWETKTYQFFSAVAPKHTGTA